MNLNKINHWLRNKYAILYVSLKLSLIRCSSYVFHKVKKLKITIEKYVQID